MAMSSCWRASSSVNPRRSRSRKNPSRKVPSLVACSPLRQAQRFDPAGEAPGGHIPFTPRAKKSLELSLREAKALHDDYIGVQHLILAQLAISDGMPRLILSALGASAESLRADILPATARRADAGPRSFSRSCRSRAIRRPVCL